MDRCLNAHTPVPNLPVLAFLTSTGLVAPSGDLVPQNDVAHAVLQHTPPVPKIPSKVD